MCRFVNPAIIGTVCIAAMSQGAAAQCSFSTSIADAYLRQGAPRAGQMQVPSVAWTYERTPPSGNPRILLQGVTSTTWMVPDNAGAWGTPDQAFLIPLAGPLYSPDPLRDQNPYHNRAPSFEGIMLHPGFGGERARAVLTAPEAMTLTGLHVHVELLGQASGNAIVGAVIERAAGGTTVLVPDTTVLSLAAARDLSPSSGLPLTLNTGDRIAIYTSDGGNAAEDWMNVDATVDLQGRPLFLSVPIGRANCGGDPTVRIAAAGATSLRWSKDGIPLSDGPTGHGSTFSGAHTDTLTIAGFVQADVGQYSCVAVNACATVESAASQVSICFGDFNCDGTINSGDFFEYLVAFFAANLRADQNHDGVVNSQDFFDFLGVFFAGC